jgi:hypothetical protein
MPRAKAKVAEDVDPFDAMNAAKSALDDAVAHLRATAKAYHKAEMAFTMSRAASTLSGDFRLHFTGHDLHTLVRR